MKIKRYDSIYYNQYGGWDFDDSLVKECVDGELVKYDDAKAIVDRLQKRLSDTLDRYEWLDSNSTLNDFAEPFEQD